MMKKRFISLLIAFALLYGVLPLPARVLADSGSGGEAPVEYSQLVNDDYQQQSSTLFITPKTNRYEYVAEGDGNVFLNLIRKTNADITMDYVSTAKPIKANSFYVEFDTKGMPSSTPTGPRGVVQFRNTGDSDGLNKKYSKLFTLNPNGTLTFDPTNTVIPQFSSEGWTTVKAVVDLANRTVTLYVNGEETVTNAAMHNAAAFEDNVDIELIRFQLFNDNGYGGWGLDNVKLFQEKEPEVEYSQLVNDDYQQQSSTFFITPKTNRYEYVAEGNGNVFLNLIRETASDITMDYLNMANPIKTNSFYVEFDTKGMPPSTATGPRGVVQFRNTGDSDGLNKKYSKLFTLNPNGTLTFDPTNTVIPQFSSGGWTTVKAVVDLANRAVTLYVNGEKTVTNAAMHNAAAFEGNVDIELIRFQLFNDNGYGGWGLDNVKLFRENGPEPERKSVFPDDSEALSLLQGKTAVQMGSGAYYLNDTKKAPLYNTLIRNNAAMVPAQMAAELLNCPLVWNEGTQTILLDNRISIPIGSNMANVDGVSKEMEAIAFVEDGVPYVPIVSVAGFFGKNGLFHERRNLVVISDNAITLTDAEIQLMNGYLLYDRPTKERIQEDFLAKNPNNNHPRIIATAEDFNRIKQTVQSNLLLKGWVDGLIAAADSQLTAPTAQYIILDNKRLLDQSRAALKTFEAVSFAYQMTGDHKYVQRAWQEIQAVGSFPNWNPIHFLDVAELTAGVALAYDWMYDAWTPEQRTYIEGIITDFGLKPAEDTYYGAGVSGTKWEKATQNWNIVCNSGISMGALAIFEADPEYNSMILANAVRSVEYLFDQFAPDGGYDEGPGYWEYTLNYGVKFFSTLENGFGTDYHITDAKGLDKTADFVLHADSSYGVNNYHDASLGHVNPSWLFYLGTKYKNPGVISAKLRKNELLGTKPTIYDPIFYKDTSITASGIQLPLDAYFRGPEFVAMRNSWDAAKDNYLSFHAGQLNVNHYHVDSGSFVYYAMGEPWAVDLGMDNVTYKVGYGIRNDIYRVRAEGHNSLVINPDLSPGMVLDSFSPITEFVSKDRGAFSIVDLTPAYANQVSDYKRGYMMSDDRKGVIVRDEVQLNGQSELYWFMHTGANVEVIDNHTAILTQNGKQLRFEFVTDAGDVALSVMEAKALPTSPTTYQSQEASNSKFRKIAIRMNTSGELNLEVRLIPVGDPREYSGVPNVKLADWVIPDGALQALPELDQILVNGEPLENFSKDIYQYTADVANNSPSLPLVEGQGANLAIEKTITEEKAILKVFFPEDPERYNLYVISFHYVDPLSSMAGYNRYPISAVSASSVPQPENPPEAVMDSDLSTRWSASGEGEWIAIDLGESKKVDAVGIAFYNAVERTYTYAIEASSDDIHYETVYSGPSKSIDGYEIVRLDHPVNARFIRYKGNGSNVNSWNSVLELRALSTKPQYQQHSGARITGPAVVSSGELLEATFRLENVTSSVYAMQTTVSYSPALLQLVSVASLADGFSVTHSVYGNGQAQIAASNPARDSGVSGSADLLRLSFLALPAAQTVTGTVYAADVRVADRQGHVTELDAGAAYNVSITAAPAVDREDDAPPEEDAPAAEPSPANKEEVQAEVFTGAGKGTVNVEMDKERRAARVNLNGSLLEQFAKDAMDQRQSLVSIPVVQGAQSYALRIPVSLLDSQNGGLNLKLATPEGSIVLKEALLRELADEDEQTAFIEIKFEPASQTELSAAVREGIGQRPLVRISAAVNNRVIAPPLNTTFAVELPYSPAKHELSGHEHLVIWAIDEAGAAHPVPNGRYQPVTGTAAFTTQSFGPYGIAFVQKTFSDLGQAEWSRKAVEVLASKGIIDGVSASQFAPEHFVTRGDFLKMLIPALQLEASGGLALPSFEDVSPEDYDYEAIGIAQALGIIQGTGDNRFSPRALISREDMFVMVHRALLLAGVELKSENAAGLKRFADYEKIADYASADTAALVNTGIVSGDGDKLNPKSTATRAESAVLLYRLYNLQTVDK
ncbi:S-layer homology domain-containing protein [Paenibacillus sp. YN15]|uniref:S-layer homology domain-containing protein n=1 Tax=Paenibacillus sp. YN15 TaxID=1742774 RepID=UPI0015EC3484|nr:S-layer homology domain-containing protein [Paenibacillus sp. YN15]